MKIPTTLKVGGIRYKIKIVEPDDFDGKTGAQICTEKQWIKVLKSQEAFMHQAFLHEIFHAINMEMEEEKVEFLAQAFYQIVADNSELFGQGGVKKNGRKKK